MTEKTETPEVDVTTDNLDEFDALLHGRAVEAKSGDQEDQENIKEDGEESEVTEDTDPLATKEQDETEGAEEDTEDETEEKEDSDNEPGTAKTSKKKTAQERINEITAARRKAEREVDELRGELKALERRLDNKDETENKTTSSEDAVAPTPDDKNEDGSEKYPLGEFDPQFIRDLTRFTIQQETEASRIEKEERNRQSELDKAQQEIQSSWQDKLVDAETKYEDFQESVINLEDSFQGLDQDYSQYLANTIMQSEYGPDILYYLSQNIDEAEQIVQSGATQATLALGRLEAQFVTANQEVDEEVQKSTKKVTKAPKPPAKRTRGHGGKFSTAPDTDDLNAFENIFFE